MKPNRLFWKFFIILWLAQFATALGVGVLIWTHSHENLPPPPPLLHEFRDGTVGPETSPSHRPLPPRSILPPLMPIAVGSVVNLFFAWWLAGYFARPIQTLHEVFEAEASGKLDTRIGTRMGRGQNELVALGQDFDRMAERLQQLVESQRRLLHDVSHELRSPLARLQAAADLLQQQPERAQEFIERIQRDTGRIDTLVGELLTLARLDAGTTDGLDEAIDFGEIVADVIDDASFEAAANACSITTDADDPLFALGNRELLHRALENVVRNAVQSTANNSSIEVSAHTIVGRLIVTVGDRGPGVPDGDLEAIFEPFFRSGARMPSGYGLGLAIARRVALTHHGRITAANRPGGGLLVTIDLPAAK
ncbi:MAG: ATP-binding protein [Sterolibacterium sp.]|jgi:signal transduction histidine kinase